LNRNSLLAAAAGLLGGGLLLATLYGGPGALILGYLAPLPLFLAGLSLGATGAIIAGVVAAVLAGFAVGPVAAALYFVSFGLPAILLCRQALLSRQLPDGGTEWYPLGLLAVWLAGLAAAAFTLALLGFGLTGEGLLAAMRQLLADAGRYLPMEIDAAAADQLSQYLPGVMAISWQVQVVINGALAQGLLLRFGRNLRPEADIARMSLPPLMLLAFAAAMALALTDGTLGMVGKTLAAIALVPYFLVGLGFIHRQVRSWQARGVVLVVFYGLILPLFWPVPLLVIGLGLFEHAGQWRRRRGGGGGGRKEE